MSKFLLSVHIKKWILFFIIFGIILFLDQYSKIMVLNLFKNGDFDVIEVNSILNIIMVTNYGISFGLFNQVDQNQYIFIALNFAIIFVLIAWFYKSDDLPVQISLILVIAGAIGNLIDRFQHGAVIDFIDFHIQKWHYPAFNIADSAVVVGIVILVVLPLKKS